MRRHWRDLRATCGSLDRGKLPHVPSFGRRGRVASLLAIAIANSIISYIAIAVGFPVSSAA